MSVRVLRTNAATRPRARRAGTARRHPRGGPRRRTGVDGSCSNPSQPSRASRCTLETSFQARPPWIRTNGLVSAKPATASSRRRDRASATSPTRPPPPERGRSHPGYFADAARPTASPAHSMRPSTASASTHVVASVEQHVRDGHPRVRDVCRRDRDRRGADDRRARPVGPPAEPPRRRDAAEPDRDGDDTVRPRGRASRRTPAPARAAPSAVTGSRTSPDRGGRAPCATRGARCSPRPG